MDVISCNTVFDEWWPALTGIKVVLFRQHFASACSLISPQPTPPTFASWYSPGWARRVQGESYPTCRRPRRYDRRDHQPLPRLRPRLRLRPHLQRCRPARPLHRQRQRHRRYRLRWAPCPPRRHCRCPVRESNGRMHVNTD